MMTLFSSPLFPLLHTLALLATGGFFFYAHFLYQKPKLTEAKAHELLFPLLAEIPVQKEARFIHFEPITFNIASTPQEIARGKNHYLTVGFSLELETPAFEKEEKKIFEKELKNLILDEVILKLGKKFPQALLRIQERYLLKAELIDHLNLKLAGRQAPKPPPTSARGSTPESTHQPASLEKTQAPVDEVVKQLYFTQWIVQ